MTRRQLVRDRYDHVRDDLEEWLPDHMVETVLAWAAGPVAARYFGEQADALDALCIVAAFERHAVWATTEQIGVARAEGSSWNDIADALGVSRQAARKRFGWSCP